jgi:hypothetical protein
MREAHEDMTVRGGPGDTALVGADNTPSRHRCSSGDAIDSFGESHGGERSGGRSWGGAPVASMARAQLDDGVAPLADKELQPPCCDPDELLRHEGSIHVSRYTEPRRVAPLARRVMDESGARD